MNDENLISMNKRTKSEQREIARKGGIASGEARRTYKSLKQAAKAFFKENDNAAMNVIQAMYSEALDGNVKAVDKLQDLIGETLGREELAMKRKVLAQQEKSDNKNKTSFADIVAAAYQNRKNIDDDCNE